MLTIGSMRTATDSREYIAGRSDPAGTEGFQEILDRELATEKLPFSNKQPTYIVNLDLMEKLGVL